MCVTLNYIVWKGAIMQKEKLIELYTKRDASKEQIDKAIKIITSLDEYCQKNDDKLDTIKLDSLKSFINTLIAANNNTAENLLALARYYHMIDNKAVYIYFTALFGSLGVIPQICQRILERHPDLDVFKDYKEAPLGTDTKEMSTYTKAFMALLEAHFTEKEYTSLLAGNNHQIPREAMLPEKELYEKAPSLDVYLKERHDRQVATLTRHMEENKIWFEQIITQEVVDFVASDQEVLSAKRDGDYLYVTKIPFDAKAYLESTNKEDKLYHACHCPFVREGLKDGTLDVNQNWCYCSAGFAKYPFEVIFDETLEIEMLETPLAGDLRCRFKIKLPDKVIASISK